MRPLRESRPVFGERGKKRIKRRFGGQSVENADRSVRKLVSQLNKSRVREGEIKDTAGERLQRLTGLALARSKRAGEREKKWDCHLFPITPQRIPTI